MWVARQCPLSRLEGGVFCGDFDGDFKVEGYDKMEEILRHNHLAFLKKCLLFIRFANADQTIHYHLKPYPQQSQLVC